MQRAYDVALQKDKKSLLGAKMKPSKSMENSIVFSTSYNAEYNNICKIINKNMIILLSDPLLADLTNMRVNYRPAAITKFV